MRAVKHGRIELSLAGVSAVGGASREGKCVTGGQGRGERYSRGRGGRRLIAFNDVRSQVRRHAATFSLCIWTVVKYRVPRCGSYQIK